MQDNCCVECNKEFRSQAGLNGHNQWKHNRLSEKPVPHTVTGRAVEMFERVQKQLDVIRDEQENLKDMVQSLHATTASPPEGEWKTVGGRENRRFKITDEAIGVPAANNNSENDNNDSNEPNYFCKGCAGDVSVGDQECGNCGEELNWNGVRR